MAVRILIAEDNEAVRSAMSTIVHAASSDWQICGMAADGEAAIQKAVELRPDVILLDYLMPHRDGMSAARCIRPFLPKVPIIVYTVLDSPYVEAEAKRAGVNAVVQKPNSGALVAAIRDAVARKPSSGGENLPRGGASPS